MDNNGHMKITDFGLCKDELGVGVQTSTLCGTTEYMAPEVLLNLNYGFPVDWWSFGVVVYEMVICSLSFSFFSLEDFFNFSILFFFFSLPALWHASVLFSGP